MTDLSVRIGTVTLQNPVMPASGTFAEGLGKTIDLDRLGALVFKTITPEPRDGNPLPRVAEVRDGMLNAIGIPGDGAAHFIENTLPRYRHFVSPKVVSLSAPGGDAFVELARQVSGVPGVDAIEANISCPNLEEDGKAFAMRVSSTAKIVRKLRAATDKPLWVKLTPNTGEIAEVAQAAETEGADALVIANTILAMAIDPETRQPRLGNVMGGLSGPAIKPIVVRMVYQCHRAVSIPIIGCGGIMNAADTVEYLLAGAMAVQVGTATFVAPTAMIDIIEGLRQYGARHRLARIDELVGTVDLKHGDGRHDML